MNKSSGEVNNVCNILQEMCTNIDLREFSHFHNCRIFGSFNSVGYFSSYLEIPCKQFPEDEDEHDGAFLVHSVRPHRLRGTLGVVKGDWLFTPPLYQKAFIVFFLK